MIDRSGRGRNRLLVQDRFKPRDDGLRCNFGAVPIVRRAWLPSLPHEMQCAPESLGDCTRILLIHHGAQFILLDGFANHAVLEREEWLHAPHVVWSDAAHTSTL